MPAELNQLIRTIYSTSLDPSKWRLVLEELDELVGCDDVETQSNNGKAANEAWSTIKDRLTPDMKERHRKHRQDDAFDSSDPDIRRILDEHLLQAMQITEKISTINHQQHLLQQAFDRLSDAIFFLGHGNSILIANRAAYALTEAEDGLRALNGALTACNSPTAAKLRELTASIGVSPPDQTKRFEALPIPKPSGGRPLHLLAMPAIASMEEQFGAFLSGKPSVLLVVSDPDQQPAPPEDRVQAIFGLTPAEARLAAALATGMSTADYAENAGITENTARWTLKQVQAKTDCRRQADLVRLLMATTRVA
ncbi:MAG: helix-turn-helix transcriptional regulator [Geminicoccaceae bacterium]